MVGSKDTKRKRKESPPPTQSSTPAAAAAVAQPTHSSSANIESSPEIPKRTKVQAQRKFAQGQSAPTTTAYSATISTPASSNGPSTSASASREPPIEILPNKTPKTEDFLTFLCFRGTNNLPPHLDFLSQTKARGRPPKQPVTKRLAKTAKAPTNSASAAVTASSAAANIKKTAAKKGRKANNNPKGATVIAAATAAAAAAANHKTASTVKEKTVELTSTSAGAVPIATGGAATAAKAVVETDKNVESVAAASAAKTTKSPAAVVVETVEKVIEQQIKTPLDGGNTTAAFTADAVAALPFAARKRAEQVAKGNRGNANAARSRRQLRNTKQTTDVNDDAKCNNSLQTDAVVGDKRRSNRTSTKETKPLIDANEDDDDDDNDDDDDEDEYYSAKDETEEITTRPDSKESSKSVADTKASQSNSQKQVQAPANKDEAPNNNKPKEQKKPTARANITKKAAADTTTTTTLEVVVAAASPDNVNKANNNKEPAKRAAKTENPTQTTKDKPPPVKRPRQKESPIFIPSPEPSGRMTRQRAFFEPVKVPHRDDGNENNATTEALQQQQQEKEEQEEKPKTKETPIAVAPPPKLPAQPPPAKSEIEINKQTKQDKVDLKVFDFSSDDEKPLAKSLKIKANNNNGSSSTTKKSPPKQAANARGGRKAATAAKKSTVEHQKKNEPKLHVTGDDDDDDEVADNSKEIVKDLPKEDNNKVEKVATNSMVNKRGKAALKPAEPTPPPPPVVTEKQTPAAAAESSTKFQEPQQKSTTIARQSRKRTKASDVNDENEPLVVATSTSPTARSQRPSRKTKEAATIYMGIIGHKLQLADDEDDDLSLNSFPDLPNVKEVEKMEIELKKNAMQALTNAAVAAAVTAQAKAPMYTTAAFVISETVPSPILATKSPVRGSNSQSPVNDSMYEKPLTNITTTARRGRPPKQAKAAAATLSAAATALKREADSTNSAAAEKKKPTATKAAKRGEPTTKTVAALQKDKDGGVSEKSKLNDSDDEDFLLNKEVNVTKRNLAKSFSDSDDEPLAIKVHVKQGEKEVATAEVKSNTRPALPPNQSTQATPLSTLGGTLNNANTTTTKPNTTPAMSTPFANQMNAAPQQTPQQIQAQSQTQQQQSPTVVNNTVVSSTTSTTPHTIAASPFKHAEKKSPVPTSKILNVPATYSTPQQTAAAAAAAAAAMNAANYSKTYMPQQMPPVAYHTQHMPSRPCHPHPQMVPIRMPMPMPTLAQPQMVPIPAPSQSPLKYQPPPTTYPPPIEAYPSPKINPNFLTPKFDRMSMPRANFPSPSPVRFEATTPSTAPSTSSKPPPPVAATTPKTPSTAAATATSTQPPLLVVASTSAAAAAMAAAAAAAASADPLKDEIGSILAANLMPSKEESGKIFGIASVSLAQSSGPDNTKCTLGKCGSIHKPVLGPVVPTESYIGDQMSSKERRKAKVNMTHEQIQKWLNECSPDPDEIQDDLDDDFDDNLRPNMNATSPAPTRDDKESTSLSSSSKATREPGKSENTSSTAKGSGPSVKPAKTTTPTPSNKKDDKPVAADREGATVDAQTSAADAKAAKTQNSEKTGATQSEKKTAAEKTNRTAGKESPTVSSKKAAKEKDTSRASGSPANTKAAKNANNEATQQPASGAPAASAAATNKTVGKGKKNAAAATAEPKNAVNSPAAQSKTDKDACGGSTPSPATPTTTTTTGAAKTTKRTPVYNQKAQKAQVELKETTTTSHRKTAPFSYGAFSADNEKSVYTFDKDDDDDDERAAKSKPAFRRQGAQSKDEDAAATAATTPATRTSPGKRRAAAAAADKANKDLANAANNSSVSLTLSSAENSKQVKVSLESEKAAAAKNKANASQTKPTANAGKGAKGAAAKKQAAGKQSNTAGNRNRGNATKKAAGEGAGGGDSDSDGHTFYIPLQGSRLGKDNGGNIQGVAVKLGREGPEGPNQKVIMHATLVTKIGAESMNTSSADIVKTLETAMATSSTENVPAGGNKKNTKAATSTPAATATMAATAAANSAASVSPKHANVTSAQPRSKGGNANAADSTAAVTSTTNATGGSLVRVNSNSSLLSGSAKSRIAGGGAAGTSAQAAHSTSAPLKKNFKDDTPIKMANNTAFPRHDDPTQMVEAPIFRPTEKEFADPIEFIERITPIAARFGICKIVPPATFKPECRISDDMRFTGYNQYVHKMLHRWGPSAKELSAIKKYLATQSIVMTHPPWIGGMEVDLPRLYHTVQELGGLKEVIEKKKWARVAEEMCIPKLAQDRVTKLDDIYCKYLLPYDTLSPSERQKLFDEVEADWAKREARARRNADRFVNTESVSNEEDDETTEDDEESEEEVDGVSMECIVKGRSMALNQFYRIARNTMALWFKNTEPTVNEVEAEFWRHVAVRDSHVCVHSGSIDSSGWGYGFPSPGPKGKGSNYARHPWNLKVLTNNPGSVLRSLGPVMGVTVPTLHVGMLFSACCWYRDPHGLSWIEYLHTGASKLWYGIPDDQSANFRAALTSLIPTHCQNKTIWLPCDTVMVPPHMLTDRGVSLCRIEQKPGEFIVVFPRAYTSSVATGYVVSESVYFATTSWLDLAKDDFRDIHESCEPAMFSLEQLLFALGHDSRVLSDTLEQMLPMLHDVCEKESAAREQLKAAGVVSMEYVHNEKGAKGKKFLAPNKSVESECDLCRANLYISMVRTDEGNVYCLQHAIKNLNSGNIQAKQCKLIHAYQVEDIDKLIKVLNERIQQKRNVGANRKSK